MEGDGRTAAERLLALHDSEPWGSEYTDMYGGWCCPEHGIEWKGSPWCWYGQHWTVD